MDNADNSHVDADAPSDFIRDAIREDLAAGPVRWRDDPLSSGTERASAHRPRQERSVSISGLPREFGGVCNLRFDDTDPTKEEASYVDGIQRDIRWLGFDWEDRLYFASDYFEQLYELAVKLIEKGKAYVCDLCTEETRTFRGTVTTPGRESPYRDRSIEENLDLFARMRAGEFPDGARTLRGEDRYGVSQHEHARSCDVSHPPGVSLPPERCVVHLSDVRFYPRAVGRDREGFRIPCVRRNSKTTARFMTGISANSGFSPRGRLSSQSCLSRIRWWENDTCVR